MIIEAIILVILAALTFFFLSRKQTTSVNPISSSQLERQQVEFESRVTAEDVKVRSPKIENPIVENCINKEENDTMPGVFKLEPVQTGGQLFDFPSFPETLQKEATPTFKAFQDLVATKQRSSSPDVFSSPTRRNRNLAKPDFFKEFIIQKPLMPSMPICNSSELMSDDEDKEFATEHIVEQAFAKVVETETLVPNLNEDIAIKESEAIIRDQDVETVSKEQESNNQPTVKLPTRKNFNFRTNKAKIESKSLKPESSEAQVIVEAEPAVKEQDAEVTLKNLDLNRQSSGKIPGKKSFNFRTNKTKIESILKKDNSFSGKDHMQVDHNTENEPVINSLLDSTIDSSSNQILKERDENKDLTIKPENVLKPEEETQVKPRGFNFKNPKRKVVEKTSSSTSPLNSPKSKDAQPLVEATEVTSIKSPVLGESNKEVKKLRGFNFRNPAKVKVE